MSNYDVGKPSYGGWEGPEEQAENRAILAATASHRLDLRIQLSGRLTRADHATAGGRGMRPGCEMPSHHRV